MFKVKNKDTRTTPHAIAGWDIWLNIFEINRLMPGGNKKVTHT